LQAAAIQIGYWRRLCKSDLRARHYCSLRLNYTACIILMRIDTLPKLRPELASAFDGVTVPIV